MNRSSLVISVLALVVALTGVGAQAAGVLIGSKQIKNGSVRSIDLKNDGVKSPDLAPNSVEGEAIAPASVEGEALTLPEPTECDVTGASTLANPTLEFQRVATVCAYDKVEATSALEVGWNGSVEGHNGGEASGCVFQLRVNGQPATQGGGETFGKGIAPVSASAIFTGLAAGHYEVEIWARITIDTQYNSCTLGPAAAGIGQTVDVSEAVV